MVRDVARRRGKYRKGSLRSISAILDAAYPGRRADRPLIRTFSWWERAVSRRIAEVARPVKLVHGTLIIHCKSSAWAQELSFQQEDLLASIRQLVPKVKRVRVKVGPMPKPGQAPDPEPSRTRPLSMTELPGDVARELARIGDDEVRDALSRAACMSLGEPGDDD